MKAPARPDNEAARLKALLEYDILDTAPEQGLDDLTRLAATICGTPISLVSLIDEHRQWFKSNIGLEQNETPRDVSFCAHTILERRLFVVPDAADDPRFADTPLVEGPNAIRFYAGTPLITPQGHAIGTLCVMDRTPHELTDDQAAALEALGRQVVGQLELRRHTRDLANGEARLLEVFRRCPVPVVIYRLSDRTFVDVNFAFTELTGWGLSDVLGRTSQAVEVIDDATTAQLRPRLEAQGALRSEEIAIRTRGGIARHVLLSTEVVALRGEPHAVSTFVDITERHTAQIEASRLAAIVESSADAIIGKNLDGIVTSWNKGAEKIFGYRADEMVGESITRIIPEDRLHEETHILERIRRGEGVAHLKTKRRAKDGSVLDVTITASPIRDSNGLVVGVSKVARDISAQRKHEADARARDAKYRTLFDYAPDGLVIADRRSYYLDANVSVCEMLGYTRNELVGLHASDIVGAAEIKHIDPALEEISSAMDHQREWLMRRKDGTHFPAEVLATNMPDGTVLGVIRDVSERHRANARFRRLIDSNVQGVMFWSADGTVTDANDAFLAIIASDRDALAAGNIQWPDLTPPEFAEADARAAKEIAERGACTPYEKEFTRSDGSRVPILIGTAVFADSTNDGLCFVVDLTERKKLEQQFYRAQRMESIGTLAGGIAHDLNNVFTPIMMSVELLRETAADEESQEMLTMLQRSARHGADLVQQVLLFARGAEGTRIPVSPNYVLSDLVTVLRDTLPKSINVEFTPGRDLWTITGDPTQLHQVFLNLCVNSRDAMPIGGRLTIAAENVDLDETYTGMHIDAIPGRYVMVSVADTGTGISQEIQDRIFEPFFTTKETGRGTGLGLSTALSIVKGHGGFMHMYSEPGDGTKFKVHLPAGVEGAVDRPLSAESARLPRGHGELVLIIDDEESVRKVASATLNRFGYRTLLAGNGAEGIAMYAVNARDVAIVLTDMAMPVMDGPATIVALRSINPSVRIIGSSGLSSAGGLARANGAGVKHFIPKPYTAETILTVLRQALTE